MIGISQSRTNLSIFFIMRAFAFAVAFAVVLAVASASPSKPVWPPEWTATMEFEHLPTGERTLGVYMYSQEAEYVALVNGNADGLCAGSGFVKENEPCINLATQDWRWIIDPVDQECCACCSKDEGCGPLNTHWIANSNSSYVDTATYYNLQANKVSPTHTRYPPHTHTHTSTHIHTHSTSDYIVADSRERCQLLLRDGRLADSSCAEQRRC